MIARGAGADLLKDLPSQVRVSVDGGQDIAVTTTDPTAALAALLRDLDRPVLGIDIRQPSLDDLYRELSHDRAA
ncbi:hypothetical protein ACFQ0B_31785 [Nonomuraea thailandensis]